MNKLRIPIDRSPCLFTDSLQSGELLVCDFGRSGMRLTCAIGEVSIDRRIIISRAATGTKYVESALFSLVRTLGYEKTIVVPNVKPVVKYGTGKAVAFRIVGEPCQHIG